MGLMAWPLMGIPQWVSERMKTFVHRPNKIMKMTSFAFFAAVVAVIISCMRFDVAATISYYLHTSPLEQNELNWERVDKIMTAQYGSGWQPMFDVCETTNRAQFSVMEARYESLIGRPRPKHPTEATT